MELFPHILSRVAALPSSQLIPFRLDYLDQLNRKIALNLQFESEKTLLIDALNNFVAESSHYQLKAYLRNLIRDIFNDRKVKFSKIESLALSKEEQEHLDTWKNKYQLTQEIQLQIGLENTHFETQYERGLSEMRIQLKTILKQKALQDGMLMASHSTLDRLHTYLEKPIATYRKKEIQNETTFWKYISRIICKTSPFSSFTHLSVLGESKLPASYQSRLRLNNLVLAYLQELLQKEESFFPHLHLRLNPSIQIVGDQFIFILNTRNIESIQEMERNDLLDFFYELLSNKTSLKPFRLLIQELLVPLEAGIEELTGFILQLVNYGFLEWDWKISGTDPEYLEKFIAKLASLESIPIAKELHQILQEIDSDRKNYPQENLLQKKQIQNTAYEKLKNFSKKLSSNLVLNQNPENKESFQRFGVTDFFFKKEQIFFEDTSRASTPDIDKEALRNLLIPFRQLLISTTALFQSKMKKAAFAFYKKNFSTRSKLSLLEFYRAFYLEHSLQDLVGNLITNLTDQDWEAQFAKHVIQEKDGTIRIRQSLTANQITSDNSITPMGALLQLYEDDGVLKGVVNASFTGFHKYFSRFISLFSEDILTSAQHWNRAILKDKCLVENRDASYFNANVHPPLVDFELSMQGSHQNLPKEQQISIADLMLRPDENEMPLLFQKSSNTELCILDFGFEAIENRSAMYQLLRSFAPETYSHLPLLEILNARFVHENEKGILIYPEINLESQLILQRKSWRVPKEILPFKKQKQNKASYFLSLNTWRLEHQLPEQVFIKLSENRAGEEPSNGHHKPQYIDFSNPFLMVLFGKMIQQVKDYLIIETALPTTKQGIKTNQDRYCMEFLLEWK